MKKTLFIMLLLAAAALINSCSQDDIDTRPQNFIDVDVIATNLANIEGFVRGFYKYGDMYNYRTVEVSYMMASASDEAAESPQGSSVQRWGQGAWNALFLPENFYNLYYQQIRTTFIFENKILPAIKAGIMSEQVKENFLGEAAFIRALFYFELFKRWGNFCLITKDMDTTSDDFSVPRSSQEECINYMVSQCDLAAGKLPVTRPTTELGRATKGAVLALKSRILLYGASPLFSENNASKWAAAASAANEVIKLNVYGLYSDYQKFFITLTGNNEIVFSRIVPANNTLESFNAPVSIPNIDNRGGGCTPSLNLVDAYEMINGTDYDWNNPTHSANPFVNRDPRFNASIIFNGSNWMTAKPVETFVGGRDNIGQARATRTGFYLKKFLDESAVWTGQAKTTFHCFPIIRYAEVLLNYAEAMNEAYGPDADPSSFGLTARNAMTLIRNRAKLTGNQNLSSTVSIGDKTKMRDAIKRERRIELAFEEHRYFDLRRWKTPVAQMLQPLRGLRIVKVQSGNFLYTPTEVENRGFDQKMYFYPFPQNEIVRNKKLVQNSGW